MSIRGAYLGTSSAISKGQTLICVSKRQSTEKLLAAYEAGARDFGENYVQELLDKQAELNLPDINWHYIGSLQSNKVKKLVGSVSLIHSVDRASVLKEINKRAGEAEISQDLLIQVNVSEEDSKSGVSPDDLCELLSMALEMENINLCGLMGFGRFVDVIEQEAERARQFILLRDLRDEMSEKLACALPELSMGVSHDYELALKYGATMVRVGSKIFGERSV